MQWQPQGKIGLCDTQIGPPICACTLDRDELQLQRVNQSNDPLQMTMTIAKFALSSLYTSKIPNLEGEEEFGSTKQRQDPPPRSKGDFHRHHHIKFLHPRMD